MTAMLKQVLLRFALPVLAPVTVGIGSAIISVFILTHQLETRVFHIEAQIERHEKALDRDFQRHEQTVAQVKAQTDDQERRLTLLEAHFGETQRLLDEIRADVKALLSGGRK